MIFSLHHHCAHAHFAERHYIALYYVCVGVRTGRISRFYALCMFIYSPMEFLIRNSPHSRPFRRFIAGISPLDISQRDSASLLKFASSRNLLLCEREKGEKNESMIIEPVVDCRKLREHPGIVSPELFVSQNAKRKRTRTCVDTGGGGDGRHAEVLSKNREIR